MSIHGRNRVTLQYRESTIGLLRFGEGDRLLIAMHGYTEDAGAFEVLSALGQRYLVVAIDLPFHGHTLWKQKEFRPEDLQEIIQLILQMESKQSFDLMGFSLGGRLVLGLLDYFQSELDGLWLLAPDGLENRWIDRVMKVPGVLRNILFRLVQRPGWIIRFAKLLHRLNLVTSFVPKFLESELSSAKHRERAFGTWASLDNFRLKPIMRLKAQLIALDIPVNLFFGKKDRIIPARLGTVLSKDAARITLHLMDGGHMLINTGLNNYLAEHKKCLD